MLKYAWLVVLALPPWAAVELGAAKWVVMLAAAPFFLFAMTLGDPDEELLGESSGKVRKVVRVAVGAGGLVLVVVIVALWKVFFPA